MKSRSTGTILIFALAAAGVLALIVFRAIAVEAVYPAERMRLFFSRSVGARIRGLFRGAVAETENAALRREVAALPVLQADVARLEIENARLRRALDYVAHRPETWISAEVLSSGWIAARARDFVRVGKGTADGVRTGAVVVAPQGLVGLVTAVTPHTAEVTLVTDPSLMVACEVEARSGAVLCGILCGGSEEALVLRHLRQGDRVRTGARVRTSGRGGVFPRGLEIGSFQPVTNGLSVAEGLVRPSVGFETLEDVFIRRDK